mmetsp:Transcript_33936/g.96157  ORF Transcript_33936/g.96157 Transcript_33936/m.96157 type:complete len:662 (-) Transcript_33936:13-1998(-)
MPAQLQSQVGEPPRHDSASWEGSLLLPPAGDGNGDAPVLEASEEPSRHNRSTLLRVCPYILGNEFCERIAYYGLAINLVNYLTKVMGLTTSESALQVMLFSGTAYLTPLLGAYLADSLWGRYKTILVFSAIYCLGMVCMAAQAAIPALTPDPGEESSTFQLVMLYIALYIIALGTGGIKPNVAAFGADQFDDHNPADVRSKKSFFMWFYFTVNCGSLLGTTVVVYVQESVSWSIGYAIPAMALFIAICCFLSGSPLYKHVQPAGSPFVRIYQVVVSAILNQGSDEASEAEQGGFSEPLIHGVSEPCAQVARGLVHTDSLRWLDKAAEPVALDSGRKKFSPKQVEEVKLVLRMLPVFLTTVIYSTVYAQFLTFFILQGDKMNRTFMGHQVPAASLTLFDTLSIIALVPAYEHLLMPCLRRLRRQPTMLQRIGWGMLVSMLAMLMAAWVECKRKRHALYSESNNLLSAYWQIPQYALIGTSEVLCMVGQLEFFYDQAPDVMRSMGMAMQMLSISLGSYLSGTITAFVQWITSGPDSQGGWLPKDLDDGRLELFFLLLATLMALDLMVFVAIAYNYVYKTVPHKQWPISQPRQPASGAARPPQGGAPRERPAPQHSSAMPISGTRRLPPGTPAHMQQPPFTSSDPYSRSITVVPQSIVLPGPMR